MERALISCLLNIKQHIQAWCCWPIIPAMYKVEARRSKIQGKPEEWFFSHPRQCGENLFSGLWIWVSDKGLVLHPQCQQQYKQNHKSIFNNTLLALIQNRELGKIFQVFFSPPCDVKLYCTSPYYKMPKVDLRRTRDKCQAVLYREEGIYYFIICIAVESWRFYSVNVLIFPLQKNCLWNLTPGVI